MIKDIWVPKYIVINGIGKNHKGYEGAWQCAAGDTETVHGVPNTLQLSFDGDTAEVYRVTPDTILQTFVNRMDEWATNEHRVRVCWWHNAKFDFQALLSRPDHQSHFAPGQPAEFVIPLSAPRAGSSPKDSPRKRYRKFLHCFAGTGGKPWFAKLYLEHDRLVWLIDTRKFFNRSLAEAAKLTGSPYLKLDQPAGLGNIDLTGNEEFEAYIRQDVLAQWHVGEAIKKTHEQYDVRVSVSLPHMASRVFRHRYLEDEDRIPYPPPAIAQAALLAFHGGKNVMRPDLGAGWYRSDPLLGFGDGLYEYDIVSAYGCAMTQLPCLTNGEWERVTEVPRGEFGILRISGRTSCPWGAIFTHDFRKINGSFEDVWMTSMEVESALDHGCVDLTAVHGWVWRSRGGRRPFEEYARHFFAQKQAAPPKTLASEVPKLLVNAIFGKTVSSVESGTMTATDSHGVSRIQHQYRASGMYNPVIGAWITGLVRAKLHKMEHRTYAMHSSTDAVKSVIPPECIPNLGKELGNWGIETGPGDCLLLRPKLYVHMPSTPEGKVKAAYHGFFEKGFKKLVEAGELALSGRAYDYTVQHCWSAKEALGGRKGHVALDFTPVPKKLRPEALQKASQWAFPHRPDLQRLLVPASVEA